MTEAEQLDRLLQMVVQEEIQRLMTQIRGWGWHEQAYAYLHQQHHPLFSVPLEKKIKCSLQETTLHECCGVLSLRSPMSRQ